MDTEAIYQAIRSLASIARRLEGRARSTADFDEAKWLKLDATLGEKQYDKIVRRLRELPN